MALSKAFSSPKYIWWKVHANLLLFICKYHVIQDASTRGSMSSLDVHLLPVFDMASSTPLLALTFDQLFCYNRDYNVLICRKHKSCVDFKAFPHHLNSYHKKLPVGLRQAWMNYSEYRYRGDPIYPDQVVCAIPELDVTDGCFQCLADPRCHFIGTKEDAMKRHLKRAHGWENPVKKGRHRKNPPSDNAADAEGRLYRSGIFAQRFFNERKARKYFEVHARDDLIVAPFLQEYFFTQKIMKEKKKRPACPEHDSDETHSEIRASNVESNGSIEAGKRPYSRMLRVEIPVTPSSFDQIQLATSLSQDDISEDEFHSTVEESL